MDFRDCLVPALPGMDRGTSHQVVQGLIQPGFENCQGWSNLPGQPVPVSHHTHSKNFLPDIETKFLLLQLVPSIPCPITAVPGEEPLSSLPLGLLHILEGCYEVPTKLSFLQAEQPHLGCLSHSVLFPFPLSRCQHEKTPQ